VVSLEAFFDEPTAFYLVIDLVRGGELFDMLGSGAAYTEVEARECSHQLVSAVEWCHRMGVVHRDLKVSGGGGTPRSGTAGLSVAAGGRRGPGRPG